MTAKTPSGAGFDEVAAKSAADNKWHHDLMSGSVKSFIQGAAWQHMQDQAAIAQMKAEIERLQNLQPSEFHEIKMLNLTAENAELKRRLIRETAAQVTEENADLLKRLASSAELTAARKDIAELEKELEKWRRGD